MEVATFLFKHLDPQILCGLVAFDLGTSIGLGGYGTRVGTEPATLTLEEASSFFCVFES